MLAALVLWRHDAVSTGSTNMVEETVSTATTIERRELDAFMVKAAVSSNNSKIARVVFICTIEATSLNSNINRKKRVILAARRSKSDSLNSNRNRTDRAACSQYKKAAVSRATSPYNSESCISSRSKQQAQSTSINIKNTARAVSPHERKSNSLKQQRQQNEQSCMFPMIERHQS